MQGDQGRALRILSEQKGWSTTKIMDNGRVVGDIARFDKMPDPIAGGDHAVGKLPFVPSNQRDFIGATEKPLRFDAPVPWNHANPDPNPQLTDLSDAGKQGGQS